MNMQQDNKILNTIENQEIWTLFVIEFLHTPEDSGTAADAQSAISMPSSMP